MKKKTTLEDISYIFGNVWIVFLWGQPNKEHNLFHRWGPAHWKLTSGTVQLMPNKVIFNHLIKSSWERQSYLKETFNYSSFPLCSHSLKR